MSFRLWRMFAILALGAALGLLWNSLPGRGLPLRGNAFLRPGDQLDLIPAAEARKRLDAGALFLDARPVAFYKMGHIPGALSLPEEDFEGAFRSLEAWLRSRFDLIVYCSGFGCEASHIVARKLREHGIQADVLDEGWPAWTDAGYPTKEGADP